MEPAFVAPAPAPSTSRIAPVSRSQQPAAAARSARSGRKGRHVQQPSNFLGRQQGSEFLGSTATLGHRARAIRVRDDARAGDVRAQAATPGNVLGVDLPPEEAKDRLLKALKPLAGPGKRKDIKKIMIIGSGPIVIGSACEFDYSGSQACKALRSEGYEVVLINSNPATIMTDPEMAERTYVNPQTIDQLEKILQKEKPDAILPTMGGQTGLNAAMDLYHAGILDKYNVELIGAKVAAIKKGEDRLEFKDLMAELNVPVPKAGIAHNIAEAKDVAEYIGSFPLIIRPAFTMGGSGGGVAYNAEEYEVMAQKGLDASPVSEILVERSLLGWKEYEMEVMRDTEDNVVIICSIENFDPMGVHTGDSITVAPIQTLTDREFQVLRDASIAIIRGVGVETGGSNIQFAVNPENGDYIVIEMNPRVSRSSALASKATGFPIAKMAAKLATGQTLAEIRNDITKETPALFEPTIDYVVVKVPRFAFEKFPGADAVLTTQMKSVGEAMSIGRSFQESLQKALRSLEVGRAGWGGDMDEEEMPLDKLRASLATPNPERVWHIRTAFERGMSVEEVFDLSQIDPWFLHKLKNLLDFEERLLPKGKNLMDITADELFRIKQEGFSDRQIAYKTGTNEMTVRAYRKKLGVLPVYKLVDTCAAEFEAFTPYYYSTYELSGESEVRPPIGKPKVMILGGGPNRIGQGIEFDYCCCHASFALRDAGYETIMVNCNPETVSTDYDTSDRLYFEPLTLEDVCNIIDAEKPAGIILQFGGQTPLKLALSLQKYVNDHPELGCKIWGTSPDSIDVAEDRERFEKILRKLDIAQPPNGLARTFEVARDVASKVEYPVVVRPSYVLGGRAMEIVYDEKELERYMEYVKTLTEGQEHPILIDHFLEDAIEIDVDAIGDTEGNYVIGGIMEHIEQAGIHSGDSACSIPTQSLSPATLATIRDWTIRIAKELKVVGLMNIQWAVQGEKVFILEANPRASRTVPYVSKAIGVPLAKLAALCMSGRSLPEFGFTKEIVPKHVAVKEAVLPFDKFPGADTLLGPEMRSTGEVMGVDYDFGKAYAKAQLAAFQRLPTQGTVFVSVNDRTKPKIVDVVKDFQALGFQVVATAGTRRYLTAQGIEVESVRKVYEGRPNVTDWLKNGWIQLMIVTPSSDPAELSEGRSVRRTALAYKVPIVTTVAGARATAAAIKALNEGLDPKPLQDYNMETHGHRFGWGAKINKILRGSEELSSMSAPADA
eukprot:tig00000157_g9695.t1